MIPVVTPDEMRAIDEAAPEPVDVLVDRAGRAVARAALDMLGGTYGRVVQVIAGKGNNGADGRVAAARLARRGVSVRVVDAVGLPRSLPPSDLVIDAAYGTGFRGDWVAPDIGDAAVLAVDIPSGVDALTGGAGTGVLPADVTLTFQAAKPGLVLGPGARLAGEVRVVDIGLDVSSASCHLVEERDVATWWPERAIDAHKWRGAVRVLAGSPGMLGAGELCAAAAARSGAGLVALSSPGTLASPRPEVIQRQIPTTDYADAVLGDLDRFGSLVVGPGLARDDAAIPAVRRCIAEAAVPVVIDGDGIFATAWSNDGPGPLIRQRERATVLTPHDGEFALLTGSRPEPDRIADVRSLAAALDAHVLLKGPTTIVGSPDRSILLVDRGDERLATAGSGDVLAGMIGAALAAGVDPARAAACAAWLHGDAGRRGGSGVLAGDLVELLPATLAALR